MKSFLTFAGLVAAAATCASAGSLPTFPKDWSAITVSHVVINQGGEEQQDGSVCCPPTSPQCKIQTIYQASKEYFDYTHNRVANKNPDGSGVVSLMDDLKEYEVNSTGYCQSYCPIPKNQAGLYPFSLPNGSVDLGPTKYNGQVVEQYEYKDQPFFNITFEVLDYYINLQNASNPIPVHMHESMQPFGMQIGYQTQDWHQFQPGTPAASHFTVLDKDNCPINPNCEQSDDRGDDPFPPSEFGGRQMEHVARDLLKIPGMIDSTFAKQHLNAANRVDQFKEASSKVINSNKINDVLEYYNQFLSVNQRRALQVAMER
eukprot:gb/GECG01006215.1/.p1 GENE.gb/GECG01006215.1/~~gb/GECG01006215.1/.p1  ORF type:complete len:316 (+),score=36.52 gb/GECG01006215.1/:1-948(+)